jgi:hypothetical protein
MKPITKIAMLTAVCLLCLQPVSAQDKQRKSAEKKSMNDQPIACNLLGLNKAQLKRQQELHEQLFSHRLEMRELSDGYAISLPSTTENIMSVAEYISLERICCSFFRFELEAGKPDDPLWFRISGGEGVKEFMKSQFVVK